uniref:DNA replication licensing factor MCM3 n=1 Tax=Dermatophagoides pteronyssinus TaxID=6956 RepID=A0A6P6XJB8_DERPT|nr:DNA replication licensing factor MCM3-like [Dermatophagoides pteronyssinus]
MSSEILVKDEIDPNAIVKVNECVEKKSNRVLLDLKTLNSLVPKLASYLINDPYIYYAALDESIKNISNVLTTHDENNYLHYVVNKEKGVNLGITGWLGVNSVTPRGIHNRLVNKMILVEGIVTRCAPVSSTLTKGVYFAEALERYFTREHNDKFSIKPKTALSTGISFELVKISDGTKVSLAHGLSEYNDVQIITIQEVPETVPTGQLPRGLDIVCCDDLVNSCKPGDRIRAIGVLKCNVYNNFGLISGLAKMFLIVNSIEVIGKSKIPKEISFSLMKHFKEVANHFKTLELIAASIAPSISGLEIVKKGLALQLVGGVRRISSVDKTQMRGDIHILLIGDPSCGKSQLLRYILKLAPLAISATGRGSSAVGLTAAVVADGSSGQRRLEAGAMVLADGGIVCIDEFDKMNEDDRVAIHEVMEQQNVSINKAGITATLNARTCVLAAANPNKGSFDDKQSYLKQINFPDSLLSRFDLIYLIKETKTAEHDRRIAKHVLSQLQCTQTNELYDQVTLDRNIKSERTANVIVQPYNKQIENPENMIVWAKHPATTLDETFILPHGISSILNFDFLKIYIDYCRNQITPELSAEACEAIAEFYSEIRDKIAHQIIFESDPKLNLPTPRLLEACIRLATAHAKLKMKQTIDEIDVEEAKKLISYTVLNENLDDFAEDVHNIDKAPNSVNRARLYNNSKLIDVSYLDYTPTKQIRVSVTPDRDLIKKQNSEHALVQMLHKLHTELGEECWDIKYVYAYAKKHNIINTNEELLTLITRLQSLNVLMMIGEKIYLI